MSITYEKDGRTILSCGCETVNGIKQNECGDHKEFDFEKYFTGMNGWICKICGAPFPPNGSILEEHWKQCSYKYRIDRIAEIVDEVTRIHIKTDLETFGGWIGMIKNTLGEETAEEYEILTLQERIPDENLQMGDS